VYSNDVARKDRARTTTTLRRITMANKNYKTITVRDLVNAVSKDKKNFPKGLDTPINSGDFEGNYWHKLHEIMTDSNNHSIFLGYEMHEGFAD
jgi:hypothetical protein